MTTSYSLATPLLLSFMIAYTILLVDFASASSHYHLGCGRGHGCYNFYNYKTTEDHYIQHNRKILMGLMVSSTTGTVADQEKEAIYREALRNAPSGPDPLHHNRGPQKSPKISP